MSAPPSRNVDCVSHVFDAWKPNKDHFTFYSATGNIEFKLWQPKEITIHLPQHLSDEFVVKLQVHNVIKFVHRSEEEEEETDSKYYYYLDDESVLNKIFKVESEAINEAVVKILSYTGFLNQALKLQLRDYFHSVSSLTCHNCHNKVRPFVIEVNKVVSIETLENVRWATSWTTLNQCTICLEEFENGVEVTRMPCSHIYHQDCIHRWLQKNSVCPIRRFPTPV